MNGLLEAAVGVRIGPWHREEDASRIVNQEVVNWLVGDLYYGSPWAAR